MYLSTSKLAVAAVGNLSFAMALCMYNLVIKVFLGTLREIELERVKEKLSSAIMETCLALTIFREEFNMSFVGMFTVLTFVKVFHWLVQDRVDYIEVTPSVSRLAHTRIVSFLLVLLGLDVLFLHQTITATLAHKGHSVQLLFAFEYIILASAAAATFLKYVLSMLDAAMEGRWDGKGTYVFYLELLTDMLHLFVYCIFFVIVFTNYGLPLHLIRDLYMTFRNFRNRITDFLRFRQVTARMDRFPDATAEDLARCDGICIICREEMQQAGLNKKLHCGHVFHLHCLRSWLERQQNCPTCRTSVFRPPPVAEATNRPQQGAAAGGAAAPPGAGVAAGIAAPPPFVEGVPAAQAAAAGMAPPAPGAPAGAAVDPAAAGFGQQGAPAPGIPANGPVLGGQAGAVGAGQGGLGFNGMVFRDQEAAAGPSGIRGASGRRTRSPRWAAAAAQHQADGSSAADSAAAAGGAFWPNAGAVPASLVWQMPQWYPVTSMAAFSNAPLQYAGQQSALDQAQAQGLATASVVPMLPAIIPAISAPFSAMIPTPVSPNVPPEQHAQAAAAAAMAAAAAAAMYMPPIMPGLAMMPPAMLPAAAPGTAGEQMAAAAAANAAAAAAAVAVMGGAAPPEVMQASFEATQQMLQRQLAYLQAQMSRIRSTEGASVPTSVAQTAGVVPMAPATSEPGVVISAAATGDAAAASSSNSSGISEPPTAAPSMAAATAASGPQHTGSQQPKDGTSAGPAGTSSSTAAAATDVAGVLQHQAIGAASAADDTAGGSNNSNSTTFAQDAAGTGSNDDADADAQELRRRRVRHFESIRGAT
eukprot:GHRR01030317.1.p1 GENE.GHRR01030317.1~~GHRR01030317.1.p1  ORF type:complete len:814 (+),score=384.97 GHRR01030317.1:119-2560(+)